MTYKQITRIKREIGAEKRELRYLVQKLNTYAKNGVYYNHLLPLIKAKRKQIELATEIIKEN